MKDVGKKLIYLGLSVAALSYVFMTSGFLFWSGAKFYTQAVYILKTSDSHKCY